MFKRYTAHTVIHMHAILLCVQTNLNNPFLDIYISAQSTLLLSFIMQGSVAMTPSPPPQLSPLKDAFQAPAILLLLQAASSGHKFQVQNLRIAA